MSFQEMLDIILALALVYFILSMVSSALSQLLMESMEIRGRTLRRYLNVIAGEKTADLLNLPQIKSLRPIRFRSWLGIFGASTEPKMVENIPIPILTDSFLELMGLAGKEDQEVEVLQKIVDDMPESEGKRAIQLWIAQGIIHLDDLKAKLEVFFSGLLEQAAATANANARSFVIGLSILIVCLLGTDTITIARDIWYAPALRAQ